MTIVTILLLYKKGVTLHVFSGMRGSQRAPHFILTIKKYQ